MYDLRMAGHRLFGVGGERKRISIWQPTGVVLHDGPIPEVRAEIHEKAKGFFNHAAQGGADLALGPEWGYDLRWIREDADLVFGSRDPIWVLGCAPCTPGDASAALADLANSVDVIAEPVPTGGAYVTPTIICCRLTNHYGDDEHPAAFVQFKTQPMSGHANPKEAQRLARGSLIWSLDQIHPSLAVIVITCADILDDTLLAEVVNRARSIRSIVAHVQANPNPDEASWVQFRRRLFGGAGNNQTYITSNWGTLLAEEVHVMGCSGLYCKRLGRGSLPDHFSSSYSQGSLNSASYKGRVEQSLLLPVDAFATYEFNLPDPAAPFHGTALFAQIQGISTEVWTDNGALASGAIPECKSDECERWRAFLPQDPWTVEMISAATLARISVPDPGDTFSMCHVKTLLADEGERFNPAFALHRQRSLEPAERCAELADAFEHARDLKGIKPATTCVQDGLPANALVGASPVSLTVAGRSDGDFRRVVGWQANWSKRNAARIRTFVVQTTKDGLLLRVGYRDEGADGAGTHPESAAGTGGTT